MRAQVSHQLEDKRHIKLLLTVLLALALLAACASSGQEAPQSNETQPPTVAPISNGAGEQTSETEDEAAAPAEEVSVPTEGDAVPESEPDPAPGDSAYDPVNTELAGRLEQQFDDFARSENFSGVVLVARNGEVLLSKGYGLADQVAGIPNDSQTRFRIGSLTKQFTAMVVLQLQEQGLLSIVDPICNYIDDCPQSWSMITIEQLLTHTAGLPDFTYFPEYESTKNVASSPDATMDRFRDLPLEFEPGTAWNYSNSGYIVLGSIIEKVTSKPYAEVVQEYIFEPLGMVDSGYDNGASNLAVGYKNAAGELADSIDMSIPFAAGALYSTANDMLRWGSSACGNTRFYRLN